MRQDVKPHPSNTTTSTDTPFSEQYNRGRENGTAIREVSMAPQIEVRGAYDYFKILLRCHIFVSILSQHTSM